jgi:hypothetical protein
VSSLNFSFQLLPIRQPLPALLVLRPRVINCHLLFPIPAFVNL